MRAMPWMQFVGGRFGDLLGRITGHEPDVNSAAVAISRQFHYYSSERARLELGYRSRPFRESVRDAWEWLVAHGYVTPRAARRTPPQTLGGRP
jgi:dihydroflavonol-4-reductase